ANGGGIYTSTGAVISLTPATVYHYRAVGFNTAGSTRGNDLTFTTGPGAPTASTLAASKITGRNAILNGRLATGGLNTSAYFQYGLTTNYGTYSATNSLVGTNVTLSLSNLASDLSPVTTYHFQLVAINSGGSSRGDDLTFTTSPGAPTASTL